MRQTVKGGEGAKGDKRKEAGRGGREGGEDEQTATSPSLQGGGKGKGKQAGNGKQLQRQVARFQGKARAEC